MAAAAKATPQQSEKEQKDAPHRQRFLEAVRAIRAGQSSDDLWKLYQENVIDNELYLEAVNEDTDELYLEAVNEDTDAESGGFEAYMLRCFDTCREKMQIRKEEQARRQQVLDGLVHPNQAVTFPITEKLDGMHVSGTYNIIYLPRLQIAASHKEAWQAHDELVLNSKSIFKVVNLTEAELAAVRHALNLTLSIDKLTKERDGECDKLHELLAQ